MKKVGYTILGVFLLLMSYFINQFVFSSVKAEEVPMDDVCDSKKEFTGTQVTHKPNRYCKTTCTPKGKTSFPDRKVKVSVDQTIKAGSQFTWEEVLMETSMECETEIYYDQWYQDYNVAVNQLLGALRMVAKEAHQYRSETDTKVPCQIARSYSDWREVDLKTYEAHVENQRKYYEALTQLNLNEADTLNTVADRLIPHYKEEDGPSRRDSKSTTVGTVNPGESCSSFFPGSIDSGDQHTCLRYTYKCDNKVVSKEEYNACLPKKIYKIQTPTYQTGTIMTYDRVACGDTPNTCHVAESSAKFCSISRPFWDVNKFDNYWSEVYQNAARLVNSTAPNGLPGMLADCNDNGMNYVSRAESPIATVHYKDPVGYYKDAENLTLEPTSSGPITTIVESHNVVGSKTSVPEVKTVLDLSSGQNIEYYYDLGKLKEIAWENSWGRLYSMTSTTKYAKWAKTYVKGTITTKYKYTMPEGFYQYTLKPDGASYHAYQLKPSKLEAGKYIDIGYSNYPVHYATPSNTYPISLTYNMPLVFSGNRLYPCIYEVENRIACPPEDCPNPDPGIPENPGEPGIPDTPDCVRDGNCPKWSGLNVVYRPISLSNPFPGYTGRGRDPGENWASREDIKAYITNNRHINQDKVYEKEPIYEFTLTPMVIKEIRDYNKSHQFTDFDLVCKKKVDGKSTGTRCYSEFLRTYGSKMSMRGSCSNVSVVDFYTCADKARNQDVDLLTSVRP